MSEVGWGTGLLREPRESFARSEQSAVKEAGPQNTRVLIASRPRHTKQGGGVTGLSVVLTLLSAYRAARGTGRILYCSDPVPSPSYWFCKLRQPGVHCWHSVITMIPTQEAASAGWLTQNC